MEPPSLGISEYLASSSARWQVTHPAAPLAWPPPRRIGDRRLRAELDLPKESAELGVLSIEDGRVFGVHGWVFSANGDVLPELSWYGEPSKRIVLPRALAPQRLNGTCLSLVSDWSCRNYAHFLLDALGRLAVLEEAGIALSEVDYVYCPTPPSAAAAGLLDRFGIPAAKRVFAAPELLVLAELLLVPSRPATALTYPAWLPVFLRRVVRTVASSPFPARRLYVSRRGYERRASSESEVERVLRERGFEIYQAGDRPTQPEDFNDASFVVGAHGAGLANLAFCRPGTRVLEIVPTDNAHPFYYSLSVAAGLDYAYMVGQSVVDRPLDEFGPSPYDFELDADELVAAIDEWDATNQIPVRP